MFISVIITVRNEERNMADLLDSFIIQEQPFEVLIIDSNSTDNTQKIVRAYSKKYPFIKLRIKGGTRGDCRNYGVRISHGDAVAFVDGDVILNPFWMQEIRKGFAKGDIVAGKTIQIGYHAFEDLERVELYYKGFDLTYPSCNLAYTRQLYETIEGFDPWFVTAEDIDLNLRGVDEGGKIVYCPKAVVYHRTRGSFYGFFKQAFWNGIGRKQLTLKHGSLWQDYRPDELLTRKLSLWYVARIITALMGYFAYKFFGENKRGYRKS